MVKLVEVEPAKVAELRAKLTEPELSLPEKYQVLFSLRNVKGADAHAALLTGGCYLLLLKLASLVLV